MNETDNNSLTIVELNMVESERQVCLTRFHPDGQTLFAGCYDGLIRRWKMTSEQPRQISMLTGHQGWVQNIELDRDGRFLCSCDTWGMLRLWNVDRDAVTPAWTNQTAHDGWITDLCISDDGQRIATCGRDRFVRIWDRKDGHLLEESPSHPEAICRIAMHPRTGQIVSGDILGVLRIWEPGSQTFVRSQKMEKMHLYDRIQDVPGIYALHFDHEGTTLTCAGGEPTRTGNHQGIPILHELRWPQLETIRSRVFGEAKNGFIFDLAHHSRGFWAMVTSGNPGAGQLLLVKDEDEKPFYVSTKLSNCHSLAMHPDGQRFVVAATNRNSQGNGAVRDKSGNYRGNTSPLHLFRIEETDDQ